MILLIDLGNTRIKWAYLHQQAIQFGGARAYKHSLFESLLDEIWGTYPQPTAVWVANVAAYDHEKELSHWIEKQWGIQLHFVKAAAHHGDVINVYPIPEKLGVDRWLNLIAVRQLTYAPVCVVDSGSFLTIDVMDANGQHQGGYITAGIDMMYAGLAHYSDNRLAVDLRIHAETLALGRSTRDCIVNGCCQMLVAFINQVTDDVAQRYGTETRFVISGGDADVLLPWLNKTYIHRPALVFEGLALLAQG